MCGGRDDVCVCGGGMMYVCVEGGDACVGGGCRGRDDACGGGGGGCAMGCACVWGVCMWREE